MKETQTLPAANESVPRRRLRPDWRVLAPLAFATVLLVLAIFLGWQAWLVHRADAGAAVAATARQTAARQMAAEIRTDTTRVQQALADPRVTMALGEGDAAGRVAAAAALKQILPKLIDVEFFSPDLDEVLSGDLKSLGYAKAAALMHAKVRADNPVADVRGDAQRGQQLMFALPVRAADRVVAFAVAGWPMASILDEFRRVPIGDARLELRQGDVVVAAVGSPGANATSDAGSPVAGSSLRLASADPEYFIIAPHDEFLLLVLTALCLLTALLAVWLRQVGMQRALRLLQRKPRASAQEMTLSQTLRQQVDAVSTPPVSVSAQPPIDGETLADPAIGVAPIIPVAQPADSARVDASMFRAYDIRGVVGKSLTPAFTRLLGRAIGSEARERGLGEVVVGRDGRLSGPDLVAALTEGLRESGVDVADIGAAPTPVTYFANFELGSGSGVSVTGSHNPPDYNGFKIVLGGETLAEDAIQNLYRRIVESRFSEGAGALRHVDVASAYLRRISDDIQIERPLRVVVDCGNGIAGDFAPKVLEAIGCEVIPLYCEVDGTFPNHHPDPSDLYNLKDLIVAVKHFNADLGVAFDGDGDRLGVVTPRGEVIFPDRLLMLFAIDVLARNPGATIIYDVKCTGHLQPLILNHGGSPLMWRTGHSLIKAKMRETDAAMAGEMSGHFFFGERWFGFDDGIYAAARLMEILAADPRQRSPEEVFATLPNGVSTPELKIPMSEGEHYRFMEKFAAKATFDGARLTTIDGVRADWPDGWGLVRPSNTTPVLVLRFDADTADALARIQDVFRKQLLSIDRALALPF